MKKKRLIELISFAVVVAIVCCIPAFTRTAKGTYLTEEEIMVREAFLTEAGVPDDVLKRLSVGQKDTVYRSLEEGMEYFYYESRESYAIEFKDSVQVEPTESQQPMMTISLLVFRKTEEGEDDYALFPSFRWNEETELTGDEYDLKIYEGAEIQTLNYEREGYFRVGVDGIKENMVAGTSYLTLWDANNESYLGESFAGGSLNDATLEWRGKGSEFGKHRFECNAYTLLKTKDGAEKITFALGYISTEIENKLGVSTRPQASANLNFNSKLEFNPVREGNARCCVEEFVIEIKQD